MSDQSFMPDESETPIGTPSSRKPHKPVNVWYRLSKKRSVLGRSWHRWGKYKNHKIAQKVVADEERKCPGLWEFHIGAKPNTPTRKG